MCCGLTIIQCMWRVPKIHLGQPIIQQIITLRSRQNGRHFADGLIKCIFLNENVWISTKIWQIFVPKGPIDNIQALIEIMPWCRPSFIWANDGYITDAYMRHSASMSYTAGKTIQLEAISESKVHGANMGPTRVLSAPDGPHVDPSDFAIRDVSYPHLPAQAKTTRPGLTQCSSLGKCLLVCPFDNC